MSTPAERFATYEDLCQVPDHLVAQIIHGQLIVLPRPAPRHALAASSLGEEVIGPYHKGRSGGPGGWWILFEPEEVCAEPFQAVRFSLGGLWA